MDVPIEKAELHIKAFSLERTNRFNPTNIQKQIDSFLVEARAYEHLQRHCPDEYKNLFPRYFGVLTGIPRDKYPRSCVLRQRAVVLEMVRPDLASRRILAAETTRPFDCVVNNFLEEIRDNRAIQEGGIRSFELDWYKSLLGDRLRRITSVHSGAYSW